MSALYYTYRTEHRHNGDYYFGSRQSYEPESDVTYFGSGLWLLKMSTRSKRKNLTKQILAVYEDRESALAHECRLIAAHKHDPKCKNIRGHSRFRSAPRFVVSAIEILKAQGITISLEELKNIERNIRKSSAQPQPRKSVKRTKE